MPNAFPLEWPAGFDRSPKRETSAFKLSADKSRVHLLKEILALCGDRNPVISSNVPLRKKDGQMYAEVADDKLDDPGVAVYFMFNKKQVVLCCDAWLTPGENLRALGLTVEAMRGTDRWKASGILKRAFSGLKALPAPSAAPGVQTTTSTTTGTGNEWWQILGVSPAAEPEIVKSAYRLLSKKYHPDSSGTADRDKLHQVQQAFEQAKKLNKA